MLIVEKYGRLGNNILQLLKVISYSLSFVVPEKIDLRTLKQYQSEVFKNCPDYLFDNDTVEMKRSFWDKNIDNNKYKKIMEIVTEILDIKMECDVDFDNTLIIHVRGGDALNTTGRINWKHVPFYVYKDIIDNSHYKKILVVSEDKTNPVISKILDTYSNSYFQSNSVDTDFKLIANALYVVDSQSSFTTTAILLNKDIKTLYTSNILSTETKTQYHSTTNVIKYDLKDYAKLKFTSTEERDKYLLLDNNPHLNT